LALTCVRRASTPQERRAIQAALAREVVRVHRQLQQAAATLKGPAQLPVLQAWDTAFSQVWGCWASEGRFAAAGSPTRCHTYRGRGQGRLV
jgi:hypothetical protein